MPARRNKRHSAEQWQAWIEEQASSGLSQHAFCDQKGLAKSSFRLWKHRLGLTPSSAASPSQSAAEVSPLFAPLSMPTTDETDDQARGWEIELDLGGGVCLRFRRGG